MAWSKNPQQKCIFWLNGMAGTGKSTIARTVARKLDEESRLGASFFFSRGQADRDRAAKLFTSIARSLANLPYKSLRDQWKHLIYQPLTRLGNSQQSSQVFTVIIDAFDECEGDQEVRKILGFITEAKRLETIRLVFFITSRPECPIRLGFKEMDEILHIDLLLHNVPQQIVEDDILVFLTGQMKKLQDDYDISEGWPGLQKIKIIARRAHGLFIYAATVCRFIGDPDDPDPEERLDLVLQDTTNDRVSTKALDKIYEQVLHNSIKKIDEVNKQKLHENFRYVVGSIVNLSDVLSIPDLARLLAISPSKVKRALH
ncbi:hypothetical protein MMC31_007856, partial [Peltigera leucophlebia]|nr:hypothetical protein [Peltigera leucophlebia]